MRTKPMALALCGCADRLPSAQRPVVRRPPVCHWVLVLALAMAGGCASWPRKPVADNVVSARQLSLQGIEAMQQDQWEDAERLFRSAIDTCGVDERAHRGYAEVLWKRGAQQQALEHMAEALRLSAGDPELRVQLGRMYLDHGELQQAAGQALQALQANRQLAEAWALRGDVLGRRGHASEALASYHRALSYRPHYPETQLAIAELYRLQNRPQRALGTLDALAQHYTAAQVPLEVLYLRGLALKALGRHQDAVQDLAAAAQQDHERAELFYHLSEAQLLAGDPANARLTVLEALELAPQHHASLQLKAHLDSRRQTIASAREP